jgi:hypothetical protein
LYLAKGSESYDDNCEKVPDMEITEKPTRPKCYKFKSQSGTDTPRLETVPEKEKIWRVRVKPDGTLQKPLQNLTLRGQKSGKPLQNSG